MPLGTPQLSVGQYLAEECCKTFKKIGDEIDGMLSIRQNTATSRRVAPTFCGPNGRSLFA